MEFGRFEAPLGLYLAFLYRKLCRKLCRVVGQFRDSMLTHHKLKAYEKALALLSRIIAMVSTF